MPFLTLLGSILAFLVIFSALVLVHEWGHFMAARIFKVRVDEFGIGFPPKAKVLFKRHDTEFTLNWLPLGGFVRLYGESDTDGTLAKDPASFSAKPVWQRIIIALAGVFMNFVLAFVLLAIFFMAGGRPLAVIPKEAYPFQQSSFLLATEEEAQANGLLQPNPEATAPIVVKEVQPNSDALKAGVVAGMKILTVNGKTVQSAVETVAALHNVQKGQTASLHLLDGTAERDISFTKTADTVGIAVPSTMILTGYRMNPVRAFGAAGTELGVQTTMLISALGNLGQEIAKQGTIPEEVGGPVKIAEAVHMANQLGFDALVVMAILLSVNLGVFNLLPIPALDGGRIFFLLIEAVARRPVKPAWEARAHLAGYALLLLLMVVVTGRDIWQLFGG